MSLSQVSDVDQYPPLDLIVRTVINIIHPSLTHECIPDLLDCLTMAERHRKLAVESACAALEWNTFYMNNDSSEETLLTPDELATVTQLVQADDAMREQFLRLILSFCQIDIYLLWTGSEDSVAKVPARINEYYPRRNRAKNESLSPIFQHNISDPEREHFIEMREDTIVFLERTFEWASRYLQSASDSTASFSSAFKSDSFIESCEPEAIREAPRMVIEYLRSVQEHVQISKTSQKSSLATSN